SLPPRPLLFPYTTLFRSLGAARRLDHVRILAVVRTAPPPVDGSAERAAAHHPRRVEQLILLVREKSLHVAQRLARRGRNVVGLRSEEHTSELQSLTNLVC